MNVREATGRPASPAIVNQEFYSKTCVIVGVAISSLAFSAGLLSILASKGVPLGVFNTLGNLNQIYAIGLMTFGGLTLGGIAVSKLCKSNHPVLSSSDKTKSVESVSNPSKEIDSKKEKDKIRESRERDASKKNHSVKAGADTSRRERAQLTPHANATNNASKQVDFTSPSTTTCKLPSVEYIHFPKEYKNNKAYPDALLIDIQKEVAVLREIALALSELSENQLLYFHNDYHPKGSYVAVFRKIKGVIKAFVFVHESNSNLSNLLPSEFTKDKFKSIHWNNQIGKTRPFFNIHTTITSFLKKGYPSCNVRKFETYTWICTTSYDRKTSQLQGHFEVFSNADPVLERIKNRYKKMYTNNFEEIELMNQK